MQVRRGWYGGEGEELIRCLLKWDAKKNFFLKYFFSLRALFILYLMDYRLINPIFRVSLTWSEMRPRAKFNVCRSSGNPREVHADREGLRISTLSIRRKNQAKLYPGRLMSGHRRERQRIYRCEIRFR